MLIFFFPLPTELSAILWPQKTSIKLFELHRIRGWADFEGYKNVKRSVSLCSYLQFFYSPVFAKIKLRMFTCIFACLLPYRPFHNHKAPNLVLRFTRPTDPFTILRASKAVFRQTLCSSKTWIDGIGSSKRVKRSVG